jgi:uncharacterized protein (DUF2141 family)
MERGMIRIAILLAVSCSTPTGPTQPYVAKEGVVGSAAIPAPEAIANAITVAVSGLRSDEGTVRCFLYDDGTDFPDSSVHVIARAVALPASRGATCKFAGVTRDRDFAIVILHDENNDNIFQKGPLGIPKEGYGFSNNPKVRFSAPSYDDCKFHVTSGTLAVAIEMQY